MQDPVLSRGGGKGTGALAPRASRQSSHTNPPGILSTGEDRLPTLGHTPSSSTGSGHAGAVIIPNKQQYTRSTGSPRNNCCRACSRRRSDSCSVRYQACNCFLSPVCGGGPGSGLNVGVYAESQVGWGAADRRAVRVVERELRSREKRVPVGVSGVDVVPKVCFADLNAALCQSHSLVVVH